MGEGPNLKDIRAPTPTVRLPTVTERVLAASGFVALAGGVLAYGWTTKPHPKPGNGPPVDAPQDLSPARWKRIAARTWLDCIRDQVPQLAGGVAFFALLSIFPAMAAFVSLYGLFADSRTVGEHLRILAGVLPPSALSFVAKEMAHLAQGKHPALGYAFVASFLLSVWSANGAVKAMFAGLNTAYRATERRGPIRLNLVSLAFTLGALSFAAVALGMVVAAPVMLRGLGWRGRVDPVLVNLLRWPVLVVLSATVLAVLYRFGPDRAKARWRWITPGSIAATLVGLGVSILFSGYVANFAHYERTYGALGAVVGFMTWLWLSTMVVLAGAELNQEIEAEATGEPPRLTETETPPN
jgi:membrane protein